MRAGLLLALAGLAILAPVASADPLRDRQWGLEMIGAGAAHRVTTGAGATIAVLDSGVRLDHPDLAGRLGAGRDFVEGDDRPQDGNGHGTHVLGIAGAATGNGVGVASVAPGATMLPVRVLDDRGSGTYADIAAGIDWAVANGADVINLSLGDFLPLQHLLPLSSTVDRAIGRALDAGVVVVAAAGNHGLPLCEQSADRARIVCVGAVDRSGRRASYSSVPEHSGLMAPGGAGRSDDGDVLSTYTSPDYQAFAGTSQAAPHVAGVAALLVSLGVRGAEARDRLLATARDAGRAGPDPEYGHGILDARAAVDGLAPPPSAKGDAARPRVRVRMAWRARARTILRRGLRARCTAPRSGRCRVSIFHGGRRIATGVRRVRGGRTAIVRIRASRVGRRVLRRADRRNQRLRARARVSATDARSRQRRLVIKG